MRSLSTADHARLKDNPATTRLRQQRVEARLQVSRLQSRMYLADPESHPHARAALEEAVRMAKQRVAAIDGELEAALAGRAGSSATRSNNGDRGSSYTETRSSDDDVTTAEQARAVLRSRLWHLDFVVQRHAPPAIEEPARRLRHAIGLELRRLG